MRILAVVAVAALIGTGPAFAEPADSKADGKKVKLTCRYKTVNGERFPKRFCTKSEESSEEAEARDKEEREMEETRDE